MPFPVQRPNPHPAETFTFTPTPVTDFGPGQAKAPAEDRLLWERTPRVSPLAAQQAETERRAARAREGLAMVVRLAAEGGLNLIGWDLSTAERREEAVSLTTKAAALAFLGLHESHVTTSFGMNTQPADRARIVRYQEMRAAMGRIVAAAAGVLGAAEVDAALTARVRADGQLVNRSVTT